jgi:hypothetical protein
VQQRRQKHSLSVERAGSVSVADAVAVAVAARTEPTAVDRQLLTAEEK